MAPHAIAWLMNFLTLGIFRNAQQTQLDHLGGETAI
jgi:hypothetical protein